MIICIYLLSIINVSRVEWLSQQQYVIISWGHRLIYFHALVTKCATFSSWRVKIDENCVRTRSPKVNCFPSFKFGQNGHENAQLLNSSWQPAANIVVIWYCWTQSKFKGHFLILSTWKKFVNAWHLNFLRRWR